MKEKCIIKTLKKKPKIKGVNGPFHWSILETWAGKRDSKIGQLCETDKGYATTWTEKRLRLFQAYEALVYLKVNEELSKAYKSIRANAVLHKLIVDNKNLSGNGEEGQRQAAALSANTRNILLELVELKTTVESIDKALLDHLTRSEGIVQAHIASYWKGVLKLTSAGMPPYPNSGSMAQDSAGKKLYQKHFLEIIETIEAVMG